MLRPGDEGWPDVQQPGARHGEYGGSNAAVYETETHINSLAEVNSQGLDNAHAYSLPRVPQGSVLGSSRGYSNNQ